MRFAPEIYTEKIGECKQFYCEILGFQIEKEMEGFVVLRHKQDPQYDILLCVPHSPFVNKIFHPAFRGEGLIFQIEVIDVVAEYERIKNKVQVRLELIDEPVNGKHFTIVDPNGILIDIVQFS